MMRSIAIESPPVSQDDRLMAGLSHIFGLIVALIFWATQRERKFVAFQAMQAIVFDVVVMVTFAVIGGCAFCAMFGGIGLMFPASFGLAAAGQGQGDASGPLAVVFMLITLVAALLPFAIMVVLMLVALSVFALRLYAGVSVISGQDFRYPILGAWLERYLARQG
jgi:uncharacterized membrane protein